MTSKISYNKLIQENIRHRGWLAALSWILLFLAQTVSAILKLENMLAYAETPEELEHIRSSFPGMLNGTRIPLLAFLIALLAVFCAATGYSWLHSSEKVDFYHSFPVTRIQWFGISWVGGFFIFLIPYLASSLCTLLVGSIKGILTSETLPLSCLAVLGGILGFLLIYQVTILAMVLTGKIVTGILAALVISVYAVIARSVLSDLPFVFFHTYSGYSKLLPTELTQYFSPLALFAMLLGKTAYIDQDQVWDINYIFYRWQRLLGASSEEHLVPILIFTAAFLAVLSLLSISLYRIRRSEAAGNALAFPKTAPFIKVLIAIPTSLLIGIFIGGDNRKWLIFLSVLSVILLCGIIEFIYHMDLRRLLDGKFSSLISIAAVIGTICIFQFDLFGYDAWLPKESSLQSMSFNIDEVSWYFSYPEEYDTTPDTGMLEGAAGQVTDFAPLYQLAQDGVANVKAGITPDEICQTDSSEYLALTMHFTEKSGKSTYRSYAINKEHILNTLTVLCEEENYRKKLFPIFHLDDQQVIRIQIMDIYNEPFSLNLTQEQRTQLLDAYKKDVLAADIMMLQNTAPIGEFMIDIPDAAAPISRELLSTNTISQFYLYSSYQNSLTLLEKYGYHLRTEIAPEDVTRMNYIEAIYADSADGNVQAAFSAPVSDEHLITDPEEMQEILSQIEYSSTRILGRENPSTRSVEITLIGNAEPQYYPLP